MIRLAPLTIIGGHYGSGKTEVAVNLAFYAKNAGHDVVLADIDIVNPYFRSYERRKPLEEAGIAVLTGAFGGTADLPALPPELNRLFAGQPELTALVDLGGDPVGARVLARYHDQLDELRFDFFLVLNANRPETRTLEGAKAMLDDIESMSKQPITGIISNTHLIDETSLADCLAGDELARALAAASGVPYVLATAPAALAEDAQARLAVPVLPLTRYMLKPWEDNTPEGEQYAWLHE